MDDAYFSDDDIDDADEEGDDDDGEAAAERAAATAARAAAAHLSVDASVEAALAELNMDAYDDEDEHVQSARLFGGNGPLTFYASNTDDPYITLPDDDDSDDRSSEFNLRNTGACAPCALWIGRALSWHAPHPVWPRFDHPGGTDGGRCEPLGGVRV